MRKDRIFFFSIRNLSLGVNVAENRRLGASRVVDFSITLRLVLVTQISGHHTFYVITVFCGERFANLFCILSDLYELQFFRCIRCTPCCWRARLDPKEKSASERDSARGMKGVQLLANSQHKRIKESTCTFARPQKRSFGIGASRQTFPRLLAECKEQQIAIDEQKKCRSACPLVEEHTKDRTRRSAGVM